MFSPRLFISVPWRKLRQTENLRKLSRNRFFTPYPLQKQIRKICLEGLFNFQVHEAEEL